MASTLTDKTAIDPASHTSTDHTQVDLAPLWTASDERVFQTEVLRKRPDRVDGWNPAKLFQSWFFGAPPLTAVVRALHIVALVSFLFLVRDLAELSTWGNLWKTFHHSGWTILLLLVITFSTRRLGVIKLIRYWAMGTMLTPLLVYYSYGPLNSLITTNYPDVWLVPALEELLKVSPVIVILIFHRKLRFQYGISDFLVIGFILGAGFAFTEDAMRSRAIGGGLGGFWGWLVPSIFYAGGKLVVGHAVWTSLAAVGLGLIVLHRRQAALIVVGAVLVMLPVFDHIVANDHDKVAPWIRHQLIGSYSLVFLFAGAIVLALIIDLHTIGSMTARDHLLTSPWRSFRKQSPASQETRTTGRFLVLRYARLRNGLYYHKAYQGDPWPNAPQSNHQSALREAASAGRGAGLLTGALATEHGWATDPDNPHQERWFNVQGWTPYVSYQTEKQVVATTSPAPGRPWAIRQPAAIISATWGRNLIIAAGVAVAYAVYRIATGSEPEPTFMFAPTPGDTGSYPTSMPGTKVFWGSLPGSGNPIPASSAPGGPSSSPPTPPPSDPPPDAPTDDSPPDDSNGEEC